MIHFRHKFPFYRLNMPGRMSLPTLTRTPFHAQVTFVEIYSLNVTVRSACHARNGKFYIYSPEVFAVSCNDLPISAALRTFLCLVFIHRDGLLQFTHYCNLIYFIVFYQSYFCESTSSLHKLVSPHFASPSPCTKDDYLQHALAKIL